MSEILRKRLVGFLILISTGVVFVPIFLSPTGSEQKFNLQVKEQPPVMIEEQVSRIAPDEMESLLSDLDNSVRRTEPQLYEVDTWDLQVGSFESKDNANAQVLRLRDQGFAAYVRVDERDGTNAFKVLVGPHMELRHAEETRLKLRNIYQYRSLLIKHVPLATVVE